MFGKLEKEGHFKSLQLLGGALSLLATGMNNGWKYIRQGL
jgi:hypothetical protein